MSVLLVILGILMVICGVACLATPIGTAFGVMYFYLVLLFVVGIMLIVKSIVYKRFGFGFFFGILSVIAGVFIIFSPENAFMTETLMLYIMAGWLVVRGIVAIIDAISARRLIGGGLLTLAIIVSILVICAGVYSFMHPMFFAGFLGVLASCYFIVEGVDMIVTGCVGRSIEREIRR